jgi:signal transduction histidine kinase
MISKPTITPLNFKVSSGLKRIIGRDLIVSDFVAVFELVKNSFDAHAKNVLLVFENDSIWVIDDGKGMTYQDVIDKWLFVAYSAKKDGSEDKDYRGQKQNSGAFAGNKGVGRFSCDRLGAKLTLQTKAKTASRIEKLDVNWDSFEGDDKNHFVKIPVQHSFAQSFTVPQGVNLGTQGTALRISGLRDEWSRQKLQDLKAHLTKLINPFDGLKASFSLTMRCDRELTEDEQLNVQFQEAGDEEKASVSRKIVNGPIENFIFQDLTSKTTHIDVRYSPDGKQLLTDLVDRGQLIYSISESNPYPLLSDAGFSCRLFYLNQSAKMTFARRMGVASIKFGSVFLFRNGFRVYPIGEEGDDSFRINARKQQGYARFLGTRDVIGRIDVHGDEDRFREASSRDQGLVETPASQQMETCFWEKCLKRLERYVVGVTWKDSLDKDREDASGLSSAPARSRIIELVAELVNSSEITLVNYSQDLVDILSDKVEEFESSLNDLKEFAKATGDDALTKRITRAEKRYRDLQEAEARAREIADAERAARIDAESKARKAEEEKAKTQSALDEERKRTLFLSSVSTLDVETVTNLHHQVIISAAEIHELIEGQIEKLRSGRQIDKESLFSFLEQMRLKNQQVLAIARIATKANFRMESDVISDDVAAYIVQYLRNVSAAYQDRIQIIADEPDKTFIRSFKPIELSIVIDNLVSNARKAHSPSIHISYDWPSSSSIKILFSDEGDGIPAIFDDLSRIFEKGVSTTDGSGIGLYHVRQIIQAMGGEISAHRQEVRGARFEITIPRKP